MDVFSCCDEHSRADIERWHPIKPKVFPVIGTRSFSYAAGLYSALKCSNHDMAHSHGIWSYPSLAHFLTTFNKNTPYLVSVHGMLNPWAVHHSRWKKQVAALFYEKFHLEKANCICALCEAEADAIREYGLKNTICVIPNGIDLPETGVPFPPAPWTGVLPAGKKVLLYLGRIHPIKGIPNLLRAWTMVRDGNREKISDWSLVIVGWDQAGHEADLKSQVEAAGIGDSVFFIDSQFHEGRVASYCHADAFVLPSFSEGLPNVVLEAWAYGLPVIMTPQCNIPEGFASEAAIKVDANPQTIARGLLNLLEMSDAERQAMGERGIALVKERFAWAVVASEMKAVYEWVLGGGAPPASVIWQP